MPDFDAGAIIPRAPIFDERRVSQDRRKFWRDKAAADRREGSQPLK